MKSEKSKKILAFVLCMVLMLTTSMSTMAEGGLIGGTSSESMASQEPETQSTETTTTEETQTEGINEELSTSKETIPEEPIPEVKKETETVAEETVSEETVSKEGVQSEATEIRHEFQDENGNVLTSVIANLPEGAFEAFTSDIVMEVKELDAETQEHVKALIGKNLPETEKLGNYQFYEINFKVNGENQNPNKPVTLTIEENNTNIQTEDTKKVNVFYLDKATEENKKESDEILNITSKTDLEEALKAEGKSIDNIDEYIYSDVSLNQEKNAVNKVLLKAEKSGVYGCYVKETAEAEEERIVEEPKEEIKEEVKEEAKTEETAKAETEIKETKPILTYEDEEVTINITEEKEGAIPEGTALSVKPVQKDTTEYTEVEEKLHQKAEDEEYSIAGFLAYDITLTDKDGNKIEPDGNVKVTMKYKKGVAPEDVDTEKSDLDVTVIHLEEDKNGAVKQVVDMVADEKKEANIQTTSGTKVTKAEFITDSFSNYVLAWYADDEESGLDKVETVSHTQAGITMRMIDMEGKDSNKYKIKALDSSTWIDLGGGYCAGTWNNGNWQNNLNQSGSIKKGLLKNVLGADGYPITTGTNTCITGQNSTGSAIPGTANISLASLFSRGTEVDHLFRKDIYNSTGYYEYSSFQNYAYLGNNTSFTVYDALGTPSNENQYYYKRGNFMPYNTINSNNISTNKNEYDENGSVLSDSDSAKGKTLYKTNGNNYYFGMYMGASFLQPKDGKVASKQVGGQKAPMVYEFNGDDDLWIYIDDVLVLDIGGVHDAHSGSINFNTGEVSWYDCIKGATPKKYTTTIKELFRAAKKLPNGNNWTDATSNEEIEACFDDDTLEDYTLHSFKMFYMERGAGASNLHMKFNIQVIPEGQVEVRKELENTDKEKYSNVKFAFQVYAQKIKSTDSKGNETYYDDEYELLDSATYKDSTEKVKFQDVTFNDTKYKNVFYLKPDESAIFSGLKANRKYYVIEVGVNAQQYDKVIINGVEYKAFDENAQLSGTISDVKTDKKTVEERPTVVCVNNCSAYNSRELRITKQMRDGQVTNDTFSFKIQLSNNEANQTLVPYAEGDYYLKDGERNYYYYKDGKLESNGSKSIVCGTTDANGVITGVPAGYTVIITQILSETSFLVEEVDLDKTRYLEPEKSVSNCEESDIKTADENVEEQRVADGKIELKKDAQVTIANKIKELDEPDAPFIEVTKRFNGLTKEQIRELAKANPAYQITVTNGSDKRTLTMDADKLDENLTGKDTTWVYTWKLEGCSTGTYRVVESNYKKDGYQVTPSINGSNGDSADVTVKQATIKYTSTMRETTCSSQDYPVGKVNLIVAKLTSNEGYFVWTRQPASIKARMAIVDLISSKDGIKFSPKAVLENCYFFSGVDKISSTLTFRDGEITYDGENIMHFDKSKQWAMFATGNYTVTDGQDAEVELTNTYQEETADLDLMKVSENNTDLKLDGAEFQLYKKDGNAYQKLGDVLTVKNGANEIELKGLEPGEYYLEETKAPTGYLPLGNKIYFKQEKGEVILTDMAGNPLTQEPEMWFLTTDEKNVLTIKNQVVYELPSTGGSGIYRYTIGGALLMMAAALILYKNKFKEVLNK